jgi:hypothetical protein
VRLHFLRVALLVTGGGPTPDKPNVTFAPPADPSVVCHEMTIRVSLLLRCMRNVERSRGAIFLTAPVKYT